MKKSLFHWLLLAEIGMLYSCDSLISRVGEESYPVIPLEYPETAQDKQAAEVLFGDTVPDPYRWLEKEEAPATQAWLREQRNLEQRYLNTLSFSPSLRNRLDLLAAVPLISPPVAAGSAYYLIEDKRDQSGRALYRLPSPYGEAQLLFDPQTLDLGPEAEFGELSFSADGSLLAMELGSRGSAWKAIRILDLETRKWFPETLPWVRHSQIAWVKAGFYYSRYDAPSSPRETSEELEFHQVFFHRVGANPADDELIFSDHIRPWRRYRAFTSPDERFLFLSATEASGPGNALYFQDLRASGEPIFEVIADSTRFRFQPVGSRENRLFVLTNYRAPRGRLLLINSRYPQERYWEEWIPETEERLIDAYQIGADLFAVYRSAATDQLRIFDDGGRLKRQVELPVAGRITAIRGRAGNPSLFVNLAALLQAETVYELDLQQFSWRPFRTSASDFQMENYASDWLQYQGYEGEPRRMLLIRRRDVQPDSIRPLLLLAPSAPSLNRLLLTQVFLEQGGVCVFPEIEDVSGQKAVDHLLAAAEHLLARKRAHSAQLGLWGAGWGGTIAAAAMVQRPDLFRAVILEGGAFDLIRYPRLPGGADWLPYFGLPDQPARFDQLMAYSPLHNIGKGAYPATFVLGGPTASAHSFKFTAALQNAQEAKLPILLRPASAPTRIGAAADALVFLLYNMQMGYNQQRIQ